VTLPWDNLAFVPGRPEALFFLLGKSNVIMYTTLPDVTDPPLGFVYGSRLVALDAHPARVRCLAVDLHGCVLASGDESGGLRVWLLVSQGGDASSFLRVGGLLGRRDRVDAAKWVDVPDAHRSPILSITHCASTFTDRWRVWSWTAPDWHGSSAVAGSTDDGVVATAGVDRHVRLWAWRVSEGGGLSVRPSHVLFTDGCEVLYLSGSPRLLGAGTSKGVLYVWGSEAGRLEYLADHSAAAVLCCATSTAGDVLAAGDDAGIVRLYRKGERWGLVAECPLDGPVVGACFVEDSRAVSPTMTERPLIRCLSLFLTGIPWS
jgi:WD40 repeat protein